MQNWPPSPYRPGNGIDPPYLGDREEQIEAVRAFLKDARNPRNVLITGTPRSGTTLICSLVNKLPDTVAVHEPTNV